MLEEVENVLRENGNVKIKAYFKYKNKIKVYYDHQSIEDEDRLNGSYDVLEAAELLYYLEEQRNDGRLVDE